MLGESNLEDLVHGLEYVLTYEDKDGDWMLVGDVPWEKQDVWVGLLLSGYSIPMEDPGKTKVASDYKSISGTWKESIEAAYQATEAAFPGGDIMAHLDQNLLHDDVFDDAETRRGNGSLNAVMGNKHLRIRSQALKKLSITSSADIQANCEIWAPNLVSFKFEGPPFQFIGLVFSGELVAEMQFRECYESSSPLSASKLVYYVQMFHEARKLTLSNHFTELRARISVGKMRYKEFLLEMLRMSVCHTSLSLNFELGGFPLSGDSSAVLDLKIAHFTLMASFITSPPICKVVVYFS